MTKEIYKKVRKDEWFSKYKKHSSSNNEFYICVKMEMGELPTPKRNNLPSWYIVLLMLLSCKFTKNEIDSEINKLFPHQKGIGRTERILNIFSENKCKNVEIFKNKDLVGLNWKRYSIFNKDGNSL